MDVQHLTCKYCGVQLDLKPLTKTGHPKVIGWIECERCDTWWYIWDSKRGIVPEWMLIGVPEAEI